MSSNLTNLMTIPSCFTFRNMDVFRNTHISNKNINLKNEYILIKYIQQVSEYLKKQMTGAEGQDNEELKKMLNDHDKLVEEIFQHEDKDKNGFISHEEFSGPKHDEL